MNEPEIAYPLTNAERLREIYGQRVAVDVTNDLYGRILAELDHVDALDRAERLLAGMSELVS